MAKAHEVIGEIKCHECGKECALKEQKNGLASYACGFCGFQGTSHYRDSDKGLRKRAGIGEALPVAAIEQVKELEKPQAQVDEPKTKTNETMWG